MPLSSIRFRLTLAITLGSTTLMLLLSVGLLWFMRHTAERNADKVLTAASRKVWAELNNGEQHYAIAEAISENSDLLKIDNLAMLIVNAKGEVLQKSQSVAPAWPGGKDDGWRVTTLSMNGSTLVIGLPWEKTESGLRNQALLLLALSLSVVLFSTAGAWWLVGRTLSPIRRLALQAQNASAENLNLCLVPSSQDTEIMQLVATLNSLLKRISQTVAVKGRFHAAASHELRTPLQVLSGHLEVALNRERTGPEYRAAMEEAYRQTQHLTSLTRDLLLLNQLDAASCRPPCEPVDIADICQRSLSHFQPLMERRQLNLHANLLAETELLAPPTHVEMLIRNLIENAAKYTSVGGVIRLDVIDSPSGVVFRISNACLWSLWIDRDHIFEPFYRSEASRSSEMGGNGLGLAICKAIVVVNKWEITLEPDATGICVDVLFKI